MAADVWVRLNGVGMTFGNVYVGPIDGVRGRIDDETTQPLMWSHSDDNLTYVGVNVQGEPDKHLTLKNVNMIFCDVSPGDAGVFTPADRFIRGMTAP